MPFEKPNVPITADTNTPTESENTLPDNFYSYTVQHQGNIRPEQLKSILLSGQPIFFGVDTKNQTIIYSYDQIEDKNIISGSFRLKKIDNSKLAGYATEFADNIAGPIEMIKDPSLRDKLRTAIDCIQDELKISALGKIEKPDWGIKKALDHGK